MVNQFKGETGSCQAGSYTTRVVTPLKSAVHLTVSFNASSEPLHSRSGCRTPPLGSWGIFPYEKSWWSAMLGIALVGCARDPADDGAGEV